MLKELIFYNVFHFSNKRISNCNWWEITEVKIDNFLHKNFHIKIDESLCSLKIHPNTDTGIVTEYFPKKRVILVAIFHQF